MHRLKRFGQHLRPIHGFRDVHGLAGSPVSGRRTIKKLLVANRGEIAIRVLRSAKECGMETVAIHEPNDLFHVHGADHAFELSSYMNVEEIIDIAKRSRVDAIHPGYGFLSESAEFAERVRNEHMCFIGPSVNHLAIFGDKVKARDLAIQCGIPVLNGSAHLFRDLNQTVQFIEDNHMPFPLMLKSPNGGGGTGVVKCMDKVSLERAVSRLQASKDFQGFFVEQCLENALHIEIQILGDGDGVIHLFDRDCSIQSADHQKVIEIAPAIHLAAGIRNKLFHFATKMMQSIKYENAGTVEFLVDQMNPENVYFLEVNPRVQVEHTVTEEITGVDIVQTQLLLGQGKTLSEINLSQSRCKENGIAIQARVNMTGAGEIHSFVEPSGKGVRVDSLLSHHGGKVVPIYNPTVAKIISHYGNSTNNFVSTWQGCIARLDRALASFHVDQVPTNISLLRAIVNHEAFQKGNRINTRFLIEEIAVLEKSMKAFAPKSESVGSKKRVFQTPPKDVSVVASHAPASVSKVFVSVGDEVRRGEHLAVLTSMKMDHLVLANDNGKVHSVFVQRGDIVDAEEPLLWIEHDHEINNNKDEPFVNKGDLEALHKALEFQEKLTELRNAALEMGGPANVEKHKKKGTNRLTIRERVAQLLDHKSFKEVGRVAGGLDQETGEFTPANFILGHGKIDNRNVIVAGEDFTIRGGSPSQAGLRKSVYTETLALDLRIPLVRLHEGGGGSVAGAGGGGGKTAQPSGGDAVFTRPRFESVGQVLATVPVATAALGPVAGLPASRLVASHFSVMVPNAQVLVAGPAAVERALGYSTTKEELGNCDIHTRNGVVDNLAKDEVDALNQIRTFLSYMPSNVDQVPHIVLPVHDTPDRQDESLLTMVSSVNHREIYDMRQILASVFDQGSLFEVSKDFGQGQITCYGRLMGKPCGIIANDCAYFGGAATEHGSRKMLRFMKTCQKFSLPIVFFVDEPGFDIGIDAEKAGTIRSGTAAVLTAANLQVPSASVIVRKAYGVAAAAHFGPKGNTFLWPTAQVGALPVESGVAVAFKRMLDSLPENEAKAKREELEQQFAKRTSSLPRALAFAAHDMILPQETRSVLVDWIDIHWPLVERHVATKSKSPTDFVM